jgi:tight adherence protein B
MAIGGEPVRLWRRACGATVLAFAVAVGAGGPVMAAVTVLAGLAVAAAAADLHRDRADRLVDAGLPALLDGIAAGLRSGLSFPVALRESVPAEPGPLRHDLVALAAALEAGVPVAQCLTRWRSRRPTPGTRLVTAAMALSSMLGGRSRPLDGVASTLRDHLAVDREVRAVSAQVRASAAVLVATPWAFVAFSAVQDPEVLGFFGGSPLGAGCLVAGVVLDVGGAWLMARVIRAVA